MDRSATSAPDRAAAVRTARCAALDLLPPAAAGERGEPAPAAAAGRVVPGLPILRQPPHGLHAEGQPQAHPAADAYSGYRSSLSETELEPSGSRSRDLPLPAARCLDRAAQPRLEHRYYLYSDARRLSLPGGRDGLVQPLRAELGTVEHAGNQLLPRRAGRRVPLRPTGNLELRSGLAVHLGGLPGTTEEAWDRDQHGWPRPRHRQRVYRTTVAFAQVRTDLPQRLRLRLRSVPGTGK